MGVTLLRKFLLILGALLVLTQALSVARPRAWTEDAIELSGSQHGEILPFLEARVPRKSRGGSKGGSRHSQARPKPNGKLKEGGTSKARGKSKAGGKSKAQGNSNLGTKPSTKSSAAAFPKLKVPYIDTAIHLCGVYIDCIDEKDESPRDVTAATKHRTSAVVKRARKVGGLDTMTYPSSSKLYSKPRDSNTKNIMRFQNKRIGSTAVKSFTSIMPTETYETYSTEHIIELSTVANFHTWAKKRDPKLDEFFGKRWNEELTEEKITGRVQNKQPSYSDLQIKQKGDQVRRTLNALVFDAFGSTINPEALVVLEDDLNNYKERLWNQKPTTRDEKFGKALKNSLDGAGPSSVYLTTIRTVLGVFSYLRAPAVHEKMIKINKDVIKELEYAVQLTGDPAAQNLASMWQIFLKEKFDEIGNSARTETQDGINRAQKEVKTAIAKYEKMFRERREAELQFEKKVKTGRSSKAKGKGPASYAEEQKKKQKALETELTQKYKAMRTIRAEIRKMRAEQKANSKTWTESQKEEFKDKIKAKKEAEEKAEQAVGRTKRAIHELYSHSVKMIIKNLKKDQQHLLNFEKKLNTLTMPRL